MGEVTVVSGSSSEDKYVDDVDEEEEQELDDLETDIEEDNVHIQYHSREEDSDSDDGDTVHMKTIDNICKLKKSRVTSFLFFSSTLSVCYVVLWIFL